MAVATTTLNSAQPKQLRPFDARRDLEAVADLIESCFSGTLDSDGRRYLYQMRAAARRKGFDRWAMLASSSHVLPQAGLVWEEDGKVVGNLSLVPFTSHGLRIYLIANVAVYPEYRRRGIARALTAAALEKSRNRRVNSTWLQVRHDNIAAIDLYTKMGFETQAQRTTWIGSPGTLRVESPPGVHVTSRRPRHWPQQLFWLDQNYPPALRWHFTVSLSSLKPGIWGTLNRFFNEVIVRHWCVEMKKQLIGVLSWQKSRGYADHLLLAAPPENENLVLEAVLPIIRRELHLSRPVSLDYPGGRAVEILSNAGFKPKSTLIWMEVKHDRGSSY